MIDYTLPTYTWRGKTYKTVGGLHNAMLKSYPNTGISFSADRCVLRNDVLIFVFERKFTTLGNSEIGSTPMGMG